MRQITLVKENNLKKNEYLYGRITNIPIYRTIQRKKNILFGGKFFCVEIKGSNCIKWLRKTRSTDVILEMANISVISILLGERRLTPKIKAIVVDTKTDDFALCVERAEHMSAEERKDGFAVFYESIKEIIKQWHIHRIPYEEYPNVDSFLLETNVSSNLGIINGKVVLIDIDPKCVSNDPQLQSAMSMLAKRIFRIINEK